MPDSACKTSCASHRCRGIYVAFVHWQALRASFDSWIGRMPEQCPDIGSWLLDKCKASKTLCSLSPERPTHTQDC